MLRARCLAWGKWRFGGGRMTGATWPPSPAEAPTWQKAHSALGPLPPRTWPGSEWSTSWQLSQVSVGRGRRRSLASALVYAAAWQTLHERERSLTCFLWLKRRGTVCGGKISSLG